MTDGFKGLRPQDSGDDSTVAELASRAITVLASKRLTHAIPLSERLIDRLLTEARDGSDEELDLVVSDILANGIPASELVDLYIPEAARRLGAHWNDDGASFTDVTIGVARLQGQVRELARRETRRRDGHGPSILVALVESEYHTLGAVVLTDQLRRLGATVRVMMGQDEEAILAAVASGHFECVLFSVATTENLAVVRRMVKKVRTGGGDIPPIVVGGAIALSGVDVKEKTGADHFTRDPKEALRLCALTTSPAGAGRRGSTG